MAPETMRTFLTRSPAATRALGESLGRRLPAGSIVALDGDLGSGKTCFVQGLAAGLGVADPVTSPTYTVGHRYEGDPDVSHLDLYRFTGVSAAEWADLEPYFDDAIVFVEWPEAGLGALPPASFAVSLSYGEGDARIVAVSDADPRV